jgi:predicted histidine transporter YuiF (NhaC family)
MASAMSAFSIFAVGAVAGWRDSHNVIAQGFIIISSIAFILIVADRVPFAPLAIFRN